MNLESVIPNLLIGAGLIFKGAQSFLLIRKLLLGGPGETKEEIVMLSLIDSAITIHTSFTSIGLGGLCLAAGVILLNIGAT